MSASDGLGRLAGIIERLRRQVHEAEEEADGRALIALARGILVERLGCGPTEAAGQLAALASRAGVSELELAADLINQAAHDRLAEAAGDLVAQAVRQGGRHDAGHAGGHDGGHADENADGHAGRYADGLVGGWVANGDFPHASLLEVSANSDTLPLPRIAAPGVVSSAVRLRTAEHRMAHAADTQAVATSLLEHALTPLGATAVAVWAVGPDASLRLAAYAGFSAEEARRWHYVPPGVVTPARRALTERATLSIPSLADSNLPSIGRELGGGRVTVPAGMVGRLVGVLEVGWPQPLEPQPAAVRRQLEALAELCARTMEPSEGTCAGSDAHAELIDMADGLHDPALLLEPHLGPDGVPVDFRIVHANPEFADPAGRPRGEVSGALLLETYPMAAGAGGLFEKVAHVYSTGEPFRAERLPLTTLVDEVPLTTPIRLSLVRQRDRVLLIWRVLDETTRLASLLQHAQRLGRVGAFEQDALTGDVVWNAQLFDLYGLTPPASPVPIERLAEHAHPDDADAVGRFLQTLLNHRRPASCAFRLRRADGIARHIRVVAEPVFDDHDLLLTVRGAYQDISAQHWTEVALAVTRDQLAQTEQQAAERDKLTLQLQHAIMPPSRPTLDAFDLQIGVRYRPAEAGAMVGGDWYDTVVLPSKKILFSVGDVAGHGIEAATGMVVLRNALRGLAVTGAGPGQLMAWLNLVAHQMIENLTATAVCALYDPHTRVLRWARAGHLPPILVRDDVATELPLIGGILLGAVSEAEYEEGVAELRREDTLLMYTDGLIERTDRTLAFTQEQLLRSASRSHVTLGERLDYLLAHNRSDTDDDTCLIGVRLN
ncbi:SpoIIE family protein phosphatase [Nonomuraea sp. NPDC050663]|uniref:SpoIIE family protein phosphatase n=1 Tax=Nonomuraea sp. NPDC050663 TaxID=3364370 RepID=UPI0037B5CF1F